MHNPLRTRPLLAALFLLAACSSTPAPASVPPAPASTSAPVATSSASPSVDVDTVTACREASNELGRNSFGSSLAKAVADGKVQPVALATAVQGFHAIDAGSSEPKVGAAVNDLNAAVAAMVPIAYLDWTPAQMSALATAYGDLTTWCKAVSVDMPA